MSAMQKVDEVECWLKVDEMERQIEPNHPDQMGVEPEAVNLSQRQQMRADQKLEESAGQAG